MFKPRRDTDLHGNGKRISVFICVNPWLKIALEFKKMSSKTASEMSPSLWRNYKPLSFDENQRLSSSVVTEARRVAKQIADELINRFGPKKVVLFGD